MATTDAMIPEGHLSTGNRHIARSRLRFLLEEMTGSLSYLKSETWMHVHLQHGCMYILK